MKNQFSLSLLFCGLLTVHAATHSLARAAPTSAARASLCADETPFVDASRLRSGKNIGLAGFPALEVVPGPDEASAAVVAREARVSPNITYSCSYVTPIRKFAPTPFFAFTLYGYYSQPQWKDIKKVTFTFNGQTFEAKPFYIVHGPERDRSQDAQESDYFESLNVKIPTSIARQIADNNGVVITTDPATTYLPIPASAMDRWKQLVNSVDAISKSRKRQGRKQNVRSRAVSKPKVFPGLPITEVFDEASGLTSLQTEVVPVAENFAVQGMASTANQGKPLKQPFTALLVAAVSAQPIWTNVNSVTLRSGLKSIWAVFWMKVVCLSTAPKGELSPDSCPLWALKRPANYGLA